MLSYAFLVIRLLACLPFALEPFHLVHAGLIQHPILPNDEQLLSSQHHEDFVVSKTFGFDVNWNEYGDHLAIRENVMSFPEDLRATGSIKLVPGDLSQSHSFLVLVQASSSSKEALDLISMTNSTHTIYVGSTVGSPVRSPVNIEIIIFVKTHVLQMKTQADTNSFLANQFGATNIFTYNLDITIWPKLNFETYHMDLQTVHGSITGSELSSFTAHNISISSGFGTITGNWSLPSRISLITGGGDIDVNLVPKRWSSGPWTAGDLRVTSGAGDIAIWMPFESDKLDLRNGTTEVFTMGGSITGNFVHGVHTSLKANGSINATLLPYSSFPEWGGIVHNHITTESEHGNTTVVVLPPVIDTYYKTNPLFFCISKHSGGSMKLTYPGEWGGIAVGSGQHISVSGDDYEEVARNATSVTVLRRPIGSNLSFKAFIGELHLDPCFSLGCGFSSREESVEEYPIDLAEE